MLKQAIYHQPKSNMAYAYNNEMLHIILRTSKNDIRTVSLLYGDPYEFNKEGHWMHQKIAMKKTGSTKLHDYWLISIKPKYRRLRYGFQCSDANETIFYTERGFSNTPPTDKDHYFCFPYLHPCDVFSAPEWVKDTVWYQIFPERFANGDISNDPNGTLPWGSSEPAFNNFFGGDFQGVIDHLDYIEELGINGIYFTPIFKAHSNHKYDTIDYMEIDPQFGDKDTFRHLVEECHKRGMKIMLDAVFNHSGYYFEAFQDVLKHQEDSRYKDWFHIWNFPIVTEPRPNYDTFAFGSSMPKLNTAHPEVKEYLLNVARYWIEEFDIDGWRLDVANEVDHAFWREFREVVKDVKPDAYILGEIWHDSMPWLQGDQFDAVMNYPFTNAAVDFFAKNELSAVDFASAITEVLHMYPKNVNEVNFNLLDSHDTPRILTLANENDARVRLLYLFQLSFIGSPCIYYGDEIGMTGGQDPECRACMEWDESKQNRNLLDFVRTLIALRKTEPLFGNAADLRIIDVNNEKNYVVYEKYNSDRNLIFVLNNHESSQEIKLDIPNTEIIEWQFTSNVTVEKKTITGALSTIDVGSLGFRIFESR